MSQPPRIFAPHRRLAARRRAIILQNQPNAAHYLLDDMVEDVLERLSFVQMVPQRALVVGDWTGALAANLRAQGAEVIEADPAGLRGAIVLDEEQPYLLRDFDLIASLGTLDTVNDLPGALIHMRQALKPGGVMIASFAGAGSLPTLRAIMMAADGDRPAARMHPMVDVRAGAQLLQRAGFADPVSDGRSVKVRFRSLAGLVGDVRAQGWGGVLTQNGPAVGEAGYARALVAFDEQAEDGRVTEVFEILTLSGWRR
ncbi:SAM-dependent methyltransferase [Novosphingobium sp. SG751A]|uniref:methyltransferase domain-containing protein n=1 Tax=Novosphingobium sp. SG751A TaxID=2587000 RepID=UPI00155210A1|nr:methyltransferase domain-containing protein [Novosphingobium sp. SG751A]NOW44331.1 SAM-dependent methyltransferase [Novosphingobium sp. SG751A]